MEQLRQMMGEIHVTDVRQQALFFFPNDFEDYTILKPKEHHEKMLNIMLDNVVAWGKTLKSLRQDSKIPQPKYG